MKPHAQCTFMSLKAWRPEHNHAMYIPHSRNQYTFCLTTSHEQSWDALQIYLWWTQKCGQPLSWVFDISSQCKLRLSKKRRKKVEVFTFSVSPFPFFFFFFLFFLDVCFSASSVEHGFSSFTFWSTTSVGVSSSCSLWESSSDCPSSTFS